MNAAVGDAGRGSRSEPEHGTFYDRPTQVIATTMLRALGEICVSVPPEPMLQAVRQSVARLDEQTWRRAWEIWAPQQAPQQQAGQQQAAAGTAGDTVRPAGDGGPRPTAALLVEVYPTGVRGMVVLQVRSVGREELTVDEQVRTLRSAADALVRRAAGGGR